MVYMAFLFYLQQSLTIKAVEFDVSTVTASDYTVEMQIKPEAFDLYKATHF